MVIELAVGVAVGWLWEKLAGAAEAKDNENAIRNALQGSIDHSFRKFQKKYGDKSESFFNEEFIESHVCPEILKYLTRSLHPDLDSVTQALPVNAIFLSDSGFREELEEFFGLILNSMKSHDVLQDIINYRQIEETNQIVKEVHDEQIRHSKVLDDGFNSIAFRQEEASKDTRQVLSQTTGIAQKLDQLLNLHTENLPTSKGNELHRLLAKQLDKSRDLINSGQIVDAKSLLDLIEEEVEESDNYTRFRWHTNQGACLLFHDRIQEAAEQYLVAYNFARHEEKAVANRVRAHLLLGDFEIALQETDEAISNYPNSGIIWALHINAKDLLKIDFNWDSVPEELKKDKSILLIQSSIESSKGEFEASYLLAKEAFQQDESSLDAKRAMLASVLSWATADTVKSHYKQLRTEQRESLAATVDSFGDFLSLLRGIQSKRVFVELAHNLAVAAELIGDLGLKDEVLNYAFSIYPDEDALIWYRVRDLKATGDIESIHGLTDEKLAKLEKPLLFALGEIASNSGDNNWVNLIADQLKSKELSDREKDELFGMELCSLWNSDEKAAAMELARENISRIKNYPSLLAFYIRILDEYGEYKERDQLLQECNNLPDRASSAAIIQIADLLYDFELYFDASELYQKLIEFPSDDYLSKRYLDSLIKSDQRAKAATFLKQLPPDIRASSSFMRIEANLARAMGDVDRLEDILTSELTANPLDSYVAAGFVATLYRKNKISELKEYLKSIPSFEPIVEQNEIEIAKYEMEFGYQDQALFRLYRLFRAKPGDSELAGHFLLLMLLVKDIEKFKALDEVFPGVVINMESEGESKNVVVEPRSLHGVGWAECVSDESELAKGLLGKKVGDEIYIDVGMGSKQWKIVGIDSMYIFASSIAQSVVANSASPVGPVWSVNVKKTGQDFDFSQILDSLKRRSQHVDHVFSVYEESKLPVQMLSDALGTDIVTLILEWPYRKYNYFVCTGTHEEREKIKYQITQGSSLFVLDLTTLIELKRLGLLNESLRVFGKPLVAASIKEQLLGIIQVHSKLKPSGVASEIDGNLHYQEIPQEHLDARGCFLNDMLDFIDNHCEVVPVLGPAVVTEQQASLQRYIGLGPNDTILLARERDAMLISEDGVFRSLAVGMGVKHSSWLQPILMILRDNEVISGSHYSKSILEKLQLSHSFTSVTSGDLLWSAKSTPYMLSPAVESAVDTFKSPTLELGSGVVVGSQFLRGLVKVVNPALLYDYYTLFVEALSYGRSKFKTEISESLMSSIIGELPGLKRKKYREISKKFGGLLQVPSGRQTSMRYKPIVRAIKLALREV